MKTFDSTSNKFTDISGVINKKLGYNADVHDQLSEDTIDVGTKINNYKV